MRSTIFVAAGFRGHASLASIGRRYFGARKSSALYNEFDDQHLKWQLERIGETDESPASGNQFNPQVKYPGEAEYSYRSEGTSVLAEVEDVEEKIAEIRGARSGSAPLNDIPKWYTFHPQKKSEWDEKNSHHHLHRLVRAKADRLAAAPPPRTNGQKDCSDIFADVVDDQQEIADHLSYNQSRENNQFSDLAAEYENMNFKKSEYNTVYESRKRFPLYQDLNHEQQQKFQLESQQRFQARRRVMWLKMNGLPNPKREAAQEVKRKRAAGWEAAQSEREIKRVENPETGEVKFSLPSLYPPTAPLEEVQSPVRRLEEAAEKKDIESEIRAKIRNEKRYTHAKVDAHLVTGGNTDEDKIKYHIAKRRDRISAMLRAEIEELLTWNNSSMLCHTLAGAALSIHHIEMRTSKSTIYVFYTVTNIDKLCSILPKFMREDTLTSPTKPLSIKEAQKELDRRLDIAAPKFRHRLAQKLELGYTPPIKFISYSEIEQIDKKALLRVLQTDPEPPHVSFSHAMNGIG